MKLFRRSGTTSKPRRTPRLETVSRIRVMLSSPGELREERDVFRPLLDELNDQLANDLGFVLKPVMWERSSWPGVGKDAQDVINRQLAPADLFVGVLWKTLGTPTLRAASGTVEEFERAYRAHQRHGAPYILFYFCKRPFYPTREEATEFVRVDDFRVSLKRLGVFYREYESPDQFYPLVRQHLIQILKEYQPPLPALSSLYDNVLNAISEVVKSNTPACLLYTDLDNFKRYSDRRGISQGDKLAGAIDRAVRQIVGDRGKIISVRQKNSWVDSGSGNLPSE